MTELLAGKLSVAEEEDVLAELEALQAQQVRRTARSSLTSVSLWPTGQLMLLLLRPTQVVLPSVPTAPLPDVVRVAEDEPQTGIVDDEGEAYRERPQRTAMLA